MIIGQHPVLDLLNRSEFECHLIGSRFVGKFDRERSDYDYLVITDGWDSKLRPWLKANGFESQGGGYGSDSRLLGRNVWTNTSHDQHVDVLPVSEDEARFRLRWFNSMRTVGDRSGLIAKGLKQECAWDIFWDVLAGFEGRDD